MRGEDEVGEGGLGHWDGLHRAEGNGSMRGDRVAWMDERRGEDEGWWCKLMWRVKLLKNVKVPQCAKLNRC